MCRSWIRLRSSTRSPAAGGALTRAPWPLKSSFTAVFNSNLQSDVCGAPSSGPRDRRIEHLKCLEVDFCFWWIFSGSSAWSPGLTGVSLGSHRGSRPAGGLVEERVGDLFTVALQDENGRIGTETALIKWIGES